MYYKLTYTSAPDKNIVGDDIANGIRTLDIGQTSSCGLQIPVSSIYEPLVMCSIVYSESLENWIIVRRTDAYSICVNDVELSVAIPLSSGDRLKISDGENVTELKFQTFNDGNYDPTLGVVYGKHSSSRAVYFACAAGFVALLVACISLFYPSDNVNDLHNNGLTEYEPSIYHIETDSLYLLCDSVVDGRQQEIVVAAIELKTPAYGTCFLTDEGLFVTARHCIEPWIGDDDWDGMGEGSTMSPEVMLAAKAETANFYSGTARYRLKSHSIISRDLERYEFYSTDFFVNRSRDQIICLGTDDKPIYWRTIFPLAHKRDMELGDFAYVKAADGIKGTINLASIDELKQFESQKNHDIAVVGYPINDNGSDSKATVVYGNSQHLEFDTDGNSLIGCIQMSAAINRGNSGGPVFAYINDAIKVVGIVSKADNRSDQGTFWTVPSSEIVYLHQNGDKVEEDSVTFVR